MVSYSPSGRNTAALANRPAVIDFELIYYLIHRKNVTYFEYGEDIVPRCRLLNPPPANELGELLANLLDAN